MKLFNTAIKINLLAKVINLALEAGKAILEIYSTTFSVTAKEDNSPLTLADTRSHEIITQGLIRLFPDIPILSEEGKDIPFSERSKWKSFWLVDPLDGTKEFAKRNGEFTVNIALIDQRKPIMGLIYVPAQGLLYFALQGYGAYKMSDSDLKKDILTLDQIFAQAQRIFVKKKQDCSAVAVMASRSHISPQTEEFIDKLKTRYQSINITNRGSALKICAVAEGSADIYPRFGPTMEWDIAAGQIIAEEANCLLIDVKTKDPLRYNNTKLINPDFIVINRLISVDSCLA